MADRSKRGAGGGRRRSRRTKAGDAVQRFALTTAALKLEHPDPAKQKALNGFLKHGTVSAACAAAGIGRTTWYDWRINDPTFEQLAREAEAARNEALEQVAQARAIKGSDTLLIFLLKTQMRAKYGDRNALTLVSPEVQMALQAIANLIGSKPEWNSEELMVAIAEVLTGHITT